MKDDDKIALFLYYRRHGGKCPFCGRSLMRGQNGWYCTCSEWNRIHKEAYRRRLV